MWEPFIDDFTRACIDEVIETGRLDFVDDFANIVPAVLTMAMLGLPLADWEIYCEPAHMQVYTRARQPQLGPHDRRDHAHGRAAGRVRADPQDRAAPGMITALLNAKVMDEFLPDDGIIGTVTLLIGGGFDTTTSLLAGALDWLDRAPATSGRGWSTTRATSISPTEEFLRHFTPAQGGGRTVTQDCEVEGFEFSAGDRMFLSYAMCNHDPASFPEPDEIVLDRFPNPHAAFGLGRAPLHRLEPRPPRLQVHAHARRCGGCPTTASTTRAPSSTSRSARSTATSTSRRRSRPGGARARRWPR